jgi:hypothetical protein
LKYLCSYTTLSHFIAAAGATEPGVVLLLIHPDVALVTSPQMNRKNNRYIAFRDKLLKERIGIVRLSVALANYSNFDWIKGTKVRKFIVA